MGYLFRRLKKMGGKGYGRIQKSYYKDGKGNTERGVIRKNL